MTATSRTRDGATRRRAWTFGQVAPIAALLACPKGGGPETATDTTATTGTAATTEATTEATGTTGTAASTGGDPGTTLVTGGPPDTSTSTSTDATTTGSTSDTTGDIGTTTGGDATGTTTGDTDGGPIACTDPDTGGDTGDPPECTDNADCATEACLEFRDIDPAAACVAGPGDGRTRFPGTIVDFADEAAVPSAGLRISGILGALQDPVNIQSLFPVMVGPDGVFDVTSPGPISQGIGVVGLVDAPGYARSVTVLAAPTRGLDYGPMSRAHDVWAVPAPLLVAWSQALALDPEAAPHLPLGPEGGAVGIVRDAHGAPVAGAILQSVKPDSTAVVRYLDDDGTGFNAAMTGCNGRFVILASGLAERFEVAGLPGVGVAVATTDDAVFVHALTLP